MLISVAYIRSDEQFVLRTFPHSSAPQLFDVSEFNNQNVQLILAPNLQQNDQLLEILEKEYLYCPIVEAEKYVNSIEAFENLTQEEIQQIFIPIHNNWVVQNNLTLIKQIFTVTAHLKSLWINDRTAFSEELWFILRNNLGTTNLSIIFNDVKTKKKDKERNQLIRVNISGTRLPSPTTGGEMEAALLQNYEKSFHDKFEIIEYIKDEGKMVATVAISKSPILIIAELFTITPLQQSLISSLFEGLQNLHTP